MGTWGEGLYDNDSALDDLADLLSIDTESCGIVELATRIGLAAWLNPTVIRCDEGELRARVEALSSDMEQLPQETREALLTLLANPEPALDCHSRTSEATYAIGGYSNGPRIDALLRFPGAKAVIDEFGEQMAKLLDNTLAVRGNVDLYETAGSLAPLGILIELALVGLFQPAPGRVEEWRNGFTTIDKATKSERGFWWKYVRRVRAGFDLIAPEPKVQKAAPTRPTVRRPESPAKPVGPVGPAAPVAPVERYQHPKLGVGVLLSRSGSGEEEKLDLRFEDGQTRKILAKFLTRIEG